MIPSCITGKILHVDLSENKTWIEEPPASFYRKYGGGSAMGLTYLLKEMSPTVDPLSPENILTLFTGIPTGLPISGQSRLSANALSPLTGAIGDSQCGGFFPARFKFSGFDGAVIRGRAEYPVYLLLSYGQTEIRDARHLWGKTTDEVDDLLHAELKDPKAEILQIGPAGENMVRMAAMINMCNRANGRTGMGAVMGSKNLKAVVVCGNHKVTAADPKTIQEMFKQSAQGAADSPLHIHGTPRTVALQQAAGGLPTYNFNQGQFDGYESLDGETMTATILVRRDTCFSCSIRCKRVVETEYNHQKVMPRFGGPEYETIGTFGTYCGISDLSAVAFANQLCNQYGIDTISCGATISFAMECFENGLLTTQDTGGIDLRFGNSKAVIALVHKIAHREGFGDLLAEGSARAADKIGKNAHEFLITTKGNEAPAHMPQAKKMMGLIYAVNPFGADHMSSEHDPFYEQGTATPTHLTRLAEIGLTEPQPRGSTTLEKVHMLYQSQKFFSALDTFCLCAFVWGTSCRVFGPEETAKMLRAATGWEDFTLEELLQIGDRRTNLMRAFNQRIGYSRQQDKLPAKFFTPLEGSGPIAGEHFTIEQIEQLKDQYYQFSGWDVSNGNPTSDKLASLGLEWVSALQ
jgi:aldehyde:ferredoxin oxidoreductase